MDKNEIKAIIAKRCAQELSNGNVVNLGIGIPTVVPNYLPEGVKLILQGELGMVDAGPTPDEAHADPDHIIDAGGTVASINVGGAFFDSSASFSMIRGGHVHAAILGALQVDENGDLANWIIPGKKIPGMGGAMDLVVGAEKVILAMEHTAKGNPKILKKCTLPLTAVHCVNLIVTEMCVIEVTKDGLVLTEINPEFTVEQVQAATEATLKVSPDLKPMF